MKSIKMTEDRYWDATGLYDSTLNKTQREVNAAQASATAAKYTKPASGIPKTDLASGVQASLDKADSAIQQHQSLAAYRTAAAQDAIDAAQDTAIAGKYTKPGTGIPETDLASDAQSKIDNALPKTGDGSNVTAAFTAATNRTNISTGEKLSVIFGKIAKWFADLGSAAFRAATGSITQGSTDLVESGAVYTGLSGKYAKPASGIPASDLAAAVQSSLSRADSAVEYTAQTLTDAQKTQARDNIGAADVELYTDNGIIVSDYPNTNPDNRAIVISEPVSEVIEPPTSYNVNTSIIVGKGIYDVGVSVAASAATTATGNFATLDWIAPYLEDVIIGGATLKRFNPSMGTSDKQVGAMAVGTCKIEAPAGGGSWALGYINVCTGGYAFAAGGGCLAAHNYASAIGARLKTPQASSMVCGKLNNPISGDRFEIGNGTDNTHRSNAFRVTDGGAAIAKNSLGIEKGDGAVVSITAAQLEALLNLL